jgi:hypothetical protein
MSMNEFFNCLFSSNGLAYLTGVVIFLITLILVAKRVIGFSLALIFLIFAILAALAVANQDAIKNYFNGFSSTKTTEGTYKANNTPSGTSKGAEINADIQKAFDDLKEEFLIQKDKIQKLWDEYTQSKPEDQSQQQQQQPQQQQQQPQRR